MSETLHYFYYIHNFHSINLVGRYFSVPSPVPHAHNSMIMDWVIHLNVSAVGHGLVLCLEHPSSGDESLHQTLKMFEPWAYRTIRPSLIRHYSIYRLFGPKWNFYCWNKNVFHFIIIICIFRLDSMEFDILSACRMKAKVADNNTIIQCRGRGTWTMYHGFLFIYMDGYHCAMNDVGCYVQWIFQPSAENDIT